MQNRESLIANYQKKILTPTKKKQKTGAGGTGGGGLGSDDDEQEKAVDRRGGGAQKLPARTADIHPDIQEKMGGIIAKATKLGVTLSRMTPIHTQWPNNLLRNYVFGTLVYSTKVPATFPRVEPNNTSLKAHV